MLAVPLTSLIASSLAPNPPPTKNLEVPLRRLAQARNPELIEKMTQRSEVSPHPRLLKEPAKNPK